MTKATSKKQFQPHKRKSPVEEEANVTNAFLPVSLGLVTSLHESEFKFASCKTKPRKIFCEKLVYWKAYRGFRDELLRQGKKPVRFYANAYGWIRRYIRPPGLWQQHKASDHTVSRSFVSPSGPVKLDLPSSPPTFPLPRLPLSKHSPACGTELATGESALWTGAKDEILNEHDVTFVVLLRQRKYLSVVESTTRGYYRTIAYRSAYSGARHVKLPIHTAEERAEFSSTKESMEFSCSEYWDMEMAVGASGGQAPCIQHAKKCVAMGRANFEHLLGITHPLQHPDNLLSAFMGKPTKGMIHPYPLHLALTSRWGGVERQERNYDRKVATLELPFFSGGGSDRIGEAKKRSEYTGKFMVDVSYGLPHLEQSYTSFLCCRSLRRELLLSHVSETTWHTVILRNVAASLQNINEEVVEIIRAKRLSVMDSYRDYYVSGIFTLSVYSEPLRTKKLMPETIISTLLPVHDLDLSLWHDAPRSRGGAADREFASYQGEPGSIPSCIAPGFSHVVIVPDDAANRQVFSGISRYPALTLRRRYKLTSLHFTTFGSQDRMLSIPPA
ncbi:hypothetical protein PR048_028939 [Dryococelus australis]|uniref:Uncharacterized protein n=1 Tax=Dryococelus australis TaxID=614101 RepID=A0ABQ9GCD1_9NEOP|nr:hypothetical protein PR048_028939 [Dryococelus australis]